ncbi:DegT/DnrJ/EryC1/StrS family aminotransferase [Nitrospirillum sp. BR 11828]|uniref:DegT/DnrJ/EryC1/StrS family aminotransferase n=1 Tax=Nitrospirillum sp. BR 11828 TaxID=3104325 RepID=UPI002ACAE958|nr:aminotransferase class I/II-fold pyridoxal phosphate-dependent enzyme [Nitrospirillum sp. BR 11828]MDZ5649924.1 aminotransferase class I/II-fold pyridoxal phosphate-dependent enzyme [Nitrospirillum sp. BR 11828]
MTALAEVPEAGDLIRLSDPDITPADLAAVERVMRSPTLGTGSVTAAFETAFAAYLGRRHAVAVASGTLGLLMALRAQGVGPGDEVIVSPYGFRETQHAVSLCGARPVFADIDYWAGTLAPEKVAARLTPATRAIVAGNTNGHPAAWSALRDMATAHGLVLIEDSTEAIGSRYRGALVGTFGDTAVFDFSQPGALCCGEGGMVVTDDTDIAMALRRQCRHSLAERTSVVVGGTPPYQAGLSDLAAALGLAQLRRLDEILEKRRGVQHLYFKYVQSFEGIKDPYIGPDVTEVNWFLYLVQLGTRFSRSSRDAIVEDLRLAEIEAAAYCQPLHLQRHYFDLGYRRGDYFVTEKVADRAVALPFHTHLSEDQVAYVVETMKDASVNVGAGAAIY